jgi:predicted HicB family RNase H-like nuclease
MSKASKPKAVGLNIRINQELRDDVKRMAIDQGQTVQELVAAILRAAVAQHKKGGR